MDMLSAGTVFLLRAAADCQAINAQALSTRPVGACSVLQEADDSLGSSQEKKGHRATASSGVASAGSAANGADGE